MKDGKGQGAKGKEQGPRLVLLALMLAFAAWFSAYSIRLHDAHLTHKSDLGQMDLAIWNTAHGRFVQGIKGEAVSPRLTDHVEPIFLPVSLLFWLWDDVRALLIFQAVALAAGAWPIYLFARRRIGWRVSDIRYLHGEMESQYQIPNTQYLLCKWAPLLFALAYLLTPALQAATVSEFHALPLAAPLIAWALWAVEDRRWGEFVAAGVLLAGVQEGAALLTATLGLYAAIREIGRRKTRIRVDKIPNPQSPIIAGFGVSLFGLAWFYVATFVIIPHYASLAYGLEQTPYVARFGVLGDSFGDVLKALLTRPGLVLRLVAEPLRLRYLLGLLAPTAFLALLGPEVLLLSAPLLLANLLSAFPFQYSGELHYSAPLVPFFIVAGIVGLGRLIRWSRCDENDPLRVIFRADVHAAAGATADENGPLTPNSGGTALPPKLGGWGAIFRAVPLFALTLVLLAALAWQAAAGSTPLGREFWRRVPGGWPLVTAHHRLLDRFAAQIPRLAALSVTTDLYPHLSHRERIYEFPLLGDATWALADVTGTTDRHPADVAAAIEKLLASGWGVVDAADGYILLARGQGRPTLPDAFYDFARAPAARPQHRLDMTFGGRLQLLGYDVLDEIKWRRTSLRFYWQVIETLPADATISVQVLTPDGSVADDTALRPMPALLWYPPAQWKAGETIVTAMLPWYLPRTWAPVITVGHVPAAPLTPQSWGAQGAGPAWTRHNGQLVPLETPQAPIQVDARFSAPGWSARLTGWAAEPKAAPGGDLPVTLRWQAAGPAPRDYTVFLHLQDFSGRTVATGDATPTWFVPRPTSQWPTDAEVWDGHVLALPAGLPLGRYDLVLGWYYWETGERLPRVDAQGNVLGDELVLGPVTVDQNAGPQPDLACLLVVESCASIE